MFELCFLLSYFKPKHQTGSDTHATDGLYIFLDIPEFILNRAGCAKTQPNFWKLLNSIFRWVRPQISLEYEHACFLL